MPDKTNTEPTMVYCIGATKSGTTWLYQNLAQHPETYFKSIKELHYFNSLKAKLPWVEKNLHLRLEKKQAHHLWKGTEKSHRELQEIEEYTAVYHGKRNGHNPYKNFLLEGVGNAKLIGDFSPAYSLLEAADFITMNQVFKSCKFIYLLRDPVDRAWSHLRMAYNRKYNSEHIDNDLMAQLAHQLIDGKLSEIDQRGQYSRALKNLEAAGLFGKLMIVFYEDLFQKDQLDKLCGFLGVSTFNFDTESKVHEGINAEIPNEIYLKLRKKFDTEYDYVSQLFDGELPENWQCGLVQEHKKRF